jgi:cytochrome P450
MTYPLNTSDTLELDPAYRTVRAAAELVRIQMPHGEIAWLAARYEDAVFVLRDRRFSRAEGSDRDSEPRPQRLKRTMPLVHLDPPEHTRLRAVTARPFRISVIEELRPQVRALADAMIGDLIAAGPPADLAATLAHRLPLRALALVLGIPEADDELITAWSTGSQAGRPARAELERLDERARAYIRSLMAARRAHPGRDLISELLAAQDGGHPVTDEQIEGLCVQMTVAGHAPTKAVLLNMLAILLTQPGAYAELCAHPGRIPAAVEELMRLGPMQRLGTFARYATEDIKVGGTLVRAGEAVVVDVAAGAQDEREYPEPGKLRFDRPRRPNILFGHGIHHCLGAPLVRVQYQETLTALTSRLPGLRLAAEPAWQSGMVIRFPRQFLVAW